MKKVLFLVLTLAASSAGWAAEARPPGSLLEVHAGWLGLFNAGVEAELASGYLGAEARVNGGALDLGNGSQTLLGFFAELRAYPFGNLQGLYLLGLSGFCQQPFVVTSTNLTTGAKTSSSGTAWGAPLQGGLGYKWLLGDFAVDLGVDGGVAFLVPTKIDGVAVPDTSVGLECYLNFGYRFKL